MAVISIHYNSIRMGGLFGRALDSLLATDFEPFDLYLLDNGSTDETYSFLSRRAEGAKVTVIKSRCNLGYAAGINFAVGHLKREYDYLAFVNSDVLLQRSTLGKLVHLMDQDEDVVACQPKILRLDDESRVDSAGIALSRLWRNYTIGPERTKSSTEGNERDLGQYGMTHEVFCTSGTVMLTRNAAFQLLGGFDSAFHFLNEDVDFGFKTRLLGYKHVLVGDAAAFHKGHGSTSQSSGTAYHNMRGQVQLLLRYAPVRDLIFLLPFTFLRQSIPQVLNGKLPGILDLLHAWRWNLANVRLATKVRAKLEPSRNSALLSQWLQGRGPFRLG